LEHMEDDDSTMAEATDADRQRMDQLSPMGDFKVGLKPTVVEVKPEPATEATPVAPAQPPVTASAPVAPTVPPKPTTAPTAPEYVHVIKMRMDTPGGTSTYFPVDGETSQKDFLPANLRAQALANQTGQEHGVFRSDTDALLAACKPPIKMPAPKAEAKAEAKSETKSVAKARMESLCAKLPDIAPKTAAARFSAFISGYLGIGLKQLSTATTEQITEALDALEIILDRDVNEFRSGPEESGKRLSERRAVIIANGTALWPKRPDTAKLAWMFSLKAGHTLENHKAWLDFTGLDFMPEVDAHALLRVFLLTRDAFKLAKLRKQLVATIPDFSLAKAVEQINTRAFPGIAIENAPVPALEQAIAQFCRDANQPVAKEQAPATPAPPAEVAPEVPKVKIEEPPVEEEPDGGLFGGGGW
jgi:hypothetical protein